MNEQQIEHDLLTTLEDLKYTHRHDIRDRAGLERNFREKFEQLNRVHLTETEFSRLMELIVSPDVFIASRTLRERNSFERDDGTPLFFTLVNIKDWCKNTFEVVNQLRMNTDNSHHRYDVMLLINGVPVVQIELKNLPISPRRAMQQIVDYKNDPGNGYSKTLLCFVQLFIVSNQTDTWYFANNNARHFTFNADERYLPFYQFALEDNQKIHHLHVFADEFLTKCTLAEMISRYMVLVASEQKLIMMRPYQIYAVKAIVACIQDNDGNGYIWHTTGSGKTLTSFKTATLLKDNPYIDKCLFVVDRKDLDRQTREEFNRFQEGCVEDNINTAALVRRMLSEDYADKVIVTTIQKLGLALDEGNKRNFKEQLKPLRDKRIVFIFDECHRSQFGDNHQAIKDFFPKAQMFGFTGTPIFEQNATYRQAKGEIGYYKTTLDLFQKQLHTYTISDAIEDRNVLRFHIDYFKPEGKNKSALGPSAVLTHQAIVEAILDKHDAATAGRKFNAFLATQSINDAIRYHELFEDVQAKKKAEDGQYKPLNIACVFSPPADGSPDVQQIQEDLPNERADNQVEPDKKKAALQKIITAYNVRFGSNHSIGDFDPYYQDIQKRIKDQQYTNADLRHNEKIDLTIVVDMLLTGFDSKYLNTLYVDKNLTYHSLVQAFSRTNRVLNDSKPYGNILDFRQQESAVDDAIALFSGKEIEGAKTIWLVDPAPVVIQKLEAAVKKLDHFMQGEGLGFRAEDVLKLKGDLARSTFIIKFKEVQRLRTALEQYTDLSEENKAAIEGVIPEEQMQGLRGAYLETALQLKAKQDKTDENAAVEQLDFEFVLFSSAIIDYDYIVALLSRYTSPQAGRIVMSPEQIINLIEADAKFVDEREEIAAYIRSLKVGQSLSEEDIRKGYEAFKADQNARELAEMAGRYGLEGAALQRFVDGIVKRMIFDSEQLSELLASLGLGWKPRKEKELALMAELIPLLHKLSQGRVISGLSVYEQ